MASKTSLFVFAILAVATVFGEDLLPKQTFLSRLSSSSVQAYKAIELNPNLSWNQKMSQMQQWANGQSAETQAGFSAWQQNVNSTITSLITQGDSAVTSLSSGAQSLYAQIKPIFTNYDLTGVDQCTQILPDLNSVDKSVVNELKTLPIARLAIGHCYDNHHH